MRKLLVAIACAMALCGCTNSGRARNAMRNDSAYNYGVMRTVTAYTNTGEKIGEWHGKIDVQYVGGSSYAERVDVVIFDGTEAVDRVIISGGTVVVDND